ncbi:MAG: hypothetical protein U1D30_11505 [Planctomycetota bacterium]
MLPAADAELAMIKDGYRKEEIAEAAARRSRERSSNRSKADRRILEVKAPSTATVEAVELQPGDLIAANALNHFLNGCSPSLGTRYVPENRLGTIR